MNFERKIIYTVCNYFKESIQCIQNMIPSLRLLKQLFSSNMIALQILYINASVKTVSVYGYTVRLCNSEKYVVLHCDNELWELIVTESDI